jgi:subtilisin family serine protease
MKKQVILIFLLCIALSAWAQQYRKGQVLLNINANTTTIEKVVEAIKEGDRNVTTVQSYEALSTELGYYRIFFSEAQINQAQFLERLKNIAGVDAVHLNYIAEPRGTTPNDPLFGNQWNLRKIQVEQVWDFIQGGTTANGDTIVVAVAEVSGFNPTHPDIKENIYRNLAEIANNGIDDDGNGYVDDIHGWNGTKKDGSIAKDTRNHGLPVLGIVGAKGNNKLGVTGINWHIKQMLLSEVDDEASAVIAYSYALKMRYLYNQTKGKKGAFVVALNYSGGIDDVFPTQTPFWCKMFEELGKEGILATISTSNNTKKNVEIKGDTPSQCPSPYLISVTNTDNTDDIVGACGNVSVDLSAPGGYASSGSAGTGAFTTSLNAYNEFAGTSAAAPHVAGSIALLYAFNNSSFASAAINNPASTALFIKNAILNNVDKVSALTNCTVTGGRLNLLKSFQALQRSIDETQVDNLKLYPNPVRDVLTIEITTNGGAKPLSFEIYNMLGQMVQEKSITTTLFDANYKDTIEIRNLALGVYFLTYRDTDNKFVSRRFVVQ